jgi:SAM-dependent methyltransferase
MTSTGLVSEYADLILYDAENADFEPDGSFYLAQAQRWGGPVLELGCGTGRFTIPLAEHGLPITGLDIAPTMLEHARHKAPHLAIRWVEADVRTFQLAAQFRLIFESGSTFMHLLERADQEAMLASVRRHLSPEGRFVISVWFPHPAGMVTTATEQDWFAYTALDGRAVRVSGVEHYDEVRQVKTETAYRRWRGADGQEVLRSAPLSLRYTFPQEMEALLHYTGFQVLERYGAWDQTPLVADSRLMIYVCIKALDDDVQFKPDSGR